MVEWKKKIPKALGYAEMSKLYIILEMWLKKIHVTFFS